MGAVLAFIARIFGGGFLDRILSTVDKRIQSETDREKLKADLISEHLRTRPDFMRSGGFVLMLLFAVPLAVWFASVCVYSMLWCRGCAWPQDWSIAALPSPLDQWAGAIITAIFGVVGLASMKR
jgi:hypothetical protein